LSFFGVFLSRVAWGFLFCFFGFGWVVFGCAFGPVFGVWLFFFFFGVGGGSSFLGWGFLCFGGVCFFGGFWGAFGGGFFGVGVFLGVCGVWFVFSAKRSTCNDSLLLALLYLHLPSLPPRERPLQILAPFSVREALPPHIHASGSLNQLSFLPPFH